jgi:hypothetical protein
MRNQRNTKQGPLADLAQRTRRRRRSLCEPHATKFAPPRLHDLKTHCALFDDIVTFFRWPRRPAPRSVDGSISQRDGKKMLFDRPQKKPREVRGRSPGRKTPSKEHEEHTSNGSASGCRFTTHGLNIGHGKNKILLASRSAIGDGAAEPAHDPKRIGHTLCPIRSQS